jgi:hypothetical protein
MQSFATRLGTALVVCIGLAVAAPARAEPPFQPPKAEDSARLAYMDSVLTHYEAESSRFRTWNALLGMARGAASIPVGGFVLSREFVAPGVVMVTTGGLAAASGVLDLIVYRQPFEELRAHFLARRMSGASADEILDETEREWIAKANAVRKARIRSGVLSLGVGALLLGVGAAVGLNGLALPSESAPSTDRATFASLLMGFGGMNLSTGAHSLLVEDPIENGWQSYARARSIWAQTRLHVIAFRSGGYLGVSTTF